MIPYPFHPPSIKKSSACKTCNFFTSGNLPAFRTKTFCVFLVSLIRDDTSQPKPSWRFTRIMTRVKLHTVVRCRGSVYWTVGTDRAPPCRAGNGPSLNYCAPGRVTCRLPTLRHMLAGAWATMWTHEGVNKILQQPQKATGTQYSDKTWVLDSEVWGPLSCPVPDFHPTSVETFGSATTEWRWLRSKMGIREIDNKDERWRELAQDPVECRIFIRGI